MQESESDIKQGGWKKPVAMTLVVLLAIIAILLSFAMRERVAHTTTGGSSTTYIGLDWIHSRNLLGRIYKEITIDSGRRTGTVKIEPDKKYHSYQTVYLTGQLESEGTCQILYYRSDSTIPAIPEPLLIFVNRADYYKPDGTLASSVRSGNGEVLFFFNDGSRHSRFVLKHGKLQTSEEWYPNGIIHQKMHYRNNQVHGRWTRYLSDGEVGYDAIYDKGLEVKVITNWK